MGCNAKIYAGDFLVPDELNFLRIKSHDVLF